MNKWINVEDELPNPGEEVLTWEPVMFRVDFFIGHNQDGENEGWDDGDPTHWMPLPEPPEDE